MKIFFVIILLSASFVQAQVEWVKLDFPSGITLNKIYAHDSLNLWVGGDSGAIIYSSDWGKNWITQFSDTGYSISDFHFIDSLNGWGISLGMLPPFTKLYKTSDGGNYWQIIPFDQELIALRTISFLDEFSGLVAGSSGHIYKTTDGGAKWTQCVVDSFTLDVNDIQFIDSLNAIACGGIRDFSGVVWRSTDRGETWLSLQTPYEPVSEIYVVDSSYMFGVGGEFEGYGATVLHSSDFGFTWDYESLPFPGVANSISFRTESEVWSSMGYANLVMYSTDTGKTWTSMTTPDTIEFKDLEFADSLHGIAVGKNGAIYKYTKKIVGIENQEKNLPDNFVLYQNYPNPFNSDTKIIYNLPEPGVVDIRITDILGNLISVISSYNGTGKHTYNIDMSTCAGGVYFYSVQFKDKMFTGKMVYLK